MPTSFEIARFAGLVVHMCRNEPDEFPHILVVAGDEQWTLRLPDLACLRKKDVVPLSVQRTLQRWFETELQLPDGSIGPVWELIHQEWVHLQDGLAVGNVPTPEQAAQQQRRRVIDEIAAFEGMSIGLLRSVRIDMGCLYVQYKRQEYVAKIMDLKLVPGSEPPPPDVLASLKRWLDTPARMPDGTISTIRSLAWIEWGFSRNREPVERVPTPDELTKDPNQPAKRAAGFVPWIRYRIRSVAPLTGYKLRVVFTNRAVKIVDVFRMVGMWGVFLPIFRVFKKLRYEKWDVEWPVNSNQMELSARSLWIDGVMVKPPHFKSKRNRLKAAQSGDEYA